MSDNKSVVIESFRHGLRDWKLSTAGRGETGLLSLVECAGDSIQTGNTCLKLHYDFTGALEHTTLGVYAGPGRKIMLPGTPRWIGIRVYADDNARGCLLRMNIIDGNGFTHSLDFADSQKGIDWSGWSYRQAIVSEDIPLPLLLSDSQAIRLLSVASAQDGPMTCGNLYIDGIRASYDTFSPADMPPLSISCSVPDNAVLHQNNPTLFFKICGDETGRITDSVQILVDSQPAPFPVKVSTDGAVNLPPCRWCDGPHSVAVFFTDNFGNTVEKCTCFTVDTGHARFRLSADGDSAFVGGLLRLSLWVKNAADLSEFDCRISFDPSYPVKALELSDSRSRHCTGSTAAGGLVTFQGTGIFKDGMLAQAVVKIPDRVVRGTKISYILEGRLRFASVPDDAYFIETFSQPKTFLPIAEKYSLEVQTAIVGQKTDIFIKNSNGLPEAGATVYRLDEGKSTEYIGKTGRNGRLQSYLLAKHPAKGFLYAKKGLNGSFLTRYEAFLPLLDAEPARIHFSGIGSDGGIRIIWLTNPVKSGKIPEVFLSEKEAYKSLGGFTQSPVHGVSQNIVFTGHINPLHNGIVRVNTVDLPGLRPGACYYFQAGDGACFSDMRSFSVPAAGDRFHFAVFGDTQAETSEQLVGFRKLLRLALRNSPDFLIHLGDFTDNASIFSGWDTILIALEKQTNVELLPCIGNHEYLGDLQAGVAETIFGLPEDYSNICPGLYAVDRNNVHIAVLSYTHGEKQLRQALDWLLVDMKQTLKPWKLLITHQPPYYTNSDGGNELMAKLLPPVCDAADIDVVFSGHDHIYAHTVPLYSGKPSQQGTVYIVGGTTGPKFYPLTVRKWFETCSPIEERLFLDCEVNRDRLTVTAVNEDGAILDRFFITRHIDTLL